MSDVNSHELVQFYPCLILFSAYSSPSSLSISSLASHLILLTTSLFPFYHGVPLIPRRHFSRVASQLPLAHPLLGTAQPSPLLPGSPPPRLMTCGEPWRALESPEAPVCIVSAPQPLPLAPSYTRLKSGNIQGRLTRDPTRTALVLVAVFY